jgi:hypothetical protein
MTTSLSEKVEGLATSNAVGLMCVIIGLVIFALLLFDEAIELIGLF